MNDVSSPGPAPQRSGIRTAWLIGGSILTVVVLAWSVLQVVAWIARTETEIAANEPVADLSGVTIELNNGSLLVRGGTGDEIQLTGTLVSDLVAPVFEQRREGDRWIVSARCPNRPLPTSCGAALEVEVPEGVDVRVRASNTPVRLSDLSSDLDVTTSNDSVRGEELTGESLLVRTSNDRVTLSGVRAVNVDVRTSNDRIELTFDDPPDSVVARTSNGRVSLVLPEDSQPYAVEAATSNGTVSNQVRSDPTASRRIDVRTSNDDVTVRYAG